MSQAYTEFPGEVQGVGCDMSQSLHKTCSGGGTYFGNYIFWGTVYTLKEKRLYLDVLERTALATFERAALYKTPAFTLNFDRNFLQNNKKSKYVV